MRAAASGGGASSARFAEFLTLRSAFVGKESTMQRGRDSPLFLCSLRESGEKGQKAIIPALDVHDNF